MTVKTLKSVDCKFNLFKEGRTYTGNHRKYLLENAKKVCGSPETLERIKLREALGYLGHGPRALSRKMSGLQETEFVNLPDGTKMAVISLPSNVTTDLSMDDEGNVFHTQQFLDTKTGRAALELENSKVGGWSWATSGLDGKSGGVTRLSSYHGMDYVYSPNFTENRGYIFESAGENGIDRDQILESIAKATEMEDSEAEALFDGWTNQLKLRAVELEANLEETEFFHASLMEKIENREREFVDLEGKHQTVVAAVEKEIADRKALVNFICESSPFFIPDELKHAMMENDFETARPIFESAKQVDFSQVPIGREAQPNKEKTVTTASSVGWDL